MSGGESVATLKLKVSNRESGLLEWRPCACSITSDFWLVLQPSLCTDSDDEDCGDAAGSTAPTIIAIDLATQLRHIEQKKKNKARCELAYTSESSGRSSEELMAPSAKICQQWVERVRKAQQRARRHASIRQGETVANARAASVSPLPRDVTSVVNGSDRGSRELGERLAVRDVHKAELQSSGASSSVNCGGGASVNGHSSVVDDGRSASSARGDQTEGSSNTKLLVSTAVSNSSMSSSAISFTLPPAVTSELNAERGHRQRFQRDRGVRSSVSVRPRT